MKENLGFGRDLTQLKHFVRVFATNSRLALPLC